MFDKQFFYCREICPSSLSIFRFPPSPSSKIVSYLYILFFIIYMHTFPVTKICLDTKNDKKNEQSV